MSHSGETHFYAANVKKILLEIMEYTMWLKYLCTQYGNYSSLKNTSMRRKYTLVAGVDFRKKI